MKSRKFSAVFLLIITLCLFNSCGSFDSSEPLVGRFYLQKDKVGKTIRYRVDDDGSSVEVYGDSFDCVAFDKNYIIIKRNESQYLIIPAYKGLNHLPEEGILGPFAKKDFLNKKKLLDIKTDFSCEIN